MADAGKRLVGPAVLATAATAVYTVPAGTTAIVRNIHVVNTTAGTAATFTLSIGGTATANSFFQFYGVAPTGALDWSGFLVLAAGDVLYAQGSVAATLTLTVSGVEST